MSRAFAIAILSLCASSRRLDVVDAFARDVAGTRAAPIVPPCMSSPLSSSSDATGVGGATTATTTLTEETTWRLRLLLRDVITTSGRRLDGGAALFVVEGSFVEEEGYEPPQGRFRPIVGRGGEDPAAGDGGRGAAGGGAGTTLEVVDSRWKLSEDPDDPKDGLWIWGLFKEPLYPYMLLSMETRELSLPSSMDGENDDSIPALKLYARIPHARNGGNGGGKGKDRAGGGGVELKTANLNVRVLEQIALPGATVDLYEEEAVGQISFQPLPS
jgi:hypothetical protein